MTDEKDEKYSIIEILVIVSLYIFVIYMAVGLFVHIYRTDGFSSFFPVIWHVLKQLY